MEKKQKALVVLKRLKKIYGPVRTFLEYKKPWQLLVATILSAQCTDKRVNIVTKKLFKKYRSLGELAKTSRPELEQDVRSTGFYRNKAKNILASAKIISEKFEGKVPRTMPELVLLPGVARKTANIVLSEGFGVIDGLAVDTHVKRLSCRIGLSEQKDPQKIEKDLLEIVPKKDWANFSLLLISHGRKTCTARKPKCSECALSGVCDSAFSFE